ncbi:RCC1 domain-containing protein [Arthrobacter bambusae]|nr:RCC1 domain-containing protein [Arthrobacter bambusae]
MNTKTTEPVKEGILLPEQDGTVRSWGSDSYGELGNGTTTNGSTPVQVTGNSAPVPRPTAAPPPKSPAYKPSPAEPQPTGRSLQPRSRGLRTVPPRPAQSWQRADLRGAGVRRDYLYVDQSVSGARAAQTPATS